MILEKKAMGSLEGFRSKLRPTALNLPSGVLLNCKEALVQQADFPSTKDDYWKYTRLSRVANLEIKEQTSVLGHSSNDSHLVQFVNQNLTSLHQSTPGLHLSSAVDLPQDKWQFCQYSGHLTQINACHAQSGLAIEVATSVNLETPLRINHRVEGDSTATILHHQVILGRNASAVLVVNQEGQANNAYQNILWDIIMEEGSSLHLDLFQLGIGSVYAFNSIRVTQKKDTKFVMNTITINTHFTRNEVLVFSQGTGAHTQMYGVFAGDSTNHIDNHTTIHHESPNCTSDEKYKGVMRGKSTSVFNGKLFVHKDAQKISAFQSNHNILLSLDAAVNSKPELEIYADDVKCSHGSTTGQIDEEALFYLRSRGISEQKSQELLIHAFLADIVGSLNQEVDQEAMSAQIELLFS